MKKPALLATLAILAGCTPDIAQTPPPEQIHALFDPAASPPVVPSPNSLAINPQTGLVNTPLPPNASEADKQFVAYLNQLDGFPADSPAQTRFDGELKTDTVTSANVRVFDVTAGMAPVTGYNPAPTAPPPGAGGALQVTPPPQGWIAGHEYAVVLVGGNSGLRGANGQPVVGSSVWALIRSEKPLVTCTDLSSPDCHSTTSLVSTAQARQLEQLRRLYKPIFDALAANGLPRSNIPQMWTFKISTQAVMAFQPTATPPQVPTPTDLAVDRTTGLLNIPVDPNASPANQAFVRDYLNTLNGYPVTTSGGAQVVGGTLNPATVNANTVHVIDLTPSADGGGAGGPVSATIAWNAKANAIAIAPPSGGWTKGHQYAVVVVGGANGVKTADGGEVGASNVWALARSSAPVATCADPSDPSCVSELTVVPLAPAAAAQLEQLRQAFQPLLAAFEAQGLPRDQIPIAWTFTIFSQPEAVFDPNNQVIPFPNDLLRTAPADGGTAHVNLPVPPGASPQVQALIAGLNTLDGFSTTAPAVSENADALAPLTDGARIDPASLDAGTGLVVLKPSSDPNALATDPVVIACVSCASSALPDGGTQVGAGEPEQLQFVPQVPLDEQTTYGAFLTTALKSDKGLNVVATPTFALLRSPEPLVDGNGKSTITGVSDAQAAAAEPARQALKPLFDALDAKGHPRKELALAWGFTTQSEVSVLAQLKAFPKTANLPDTPIALAAVAATPTPHASAAYAGAIVSALLLTGPNGTLKPTAPAVGNIPFTLVLPSAAPGGNGYPVAIFAHDLRRDRNDVMALADSLAAAGIASIAIDNVWHGERTSCTGSAVALQAAGVAGATDDFACGGVGATPNPVTQRCDEATPIGRCVLRVGGGAGDFWRTGANAPPVISGWNLFNPANLFATRDNFRQQVVDFAQLTRVIRATGTGSLNERLTSAGASGTLDGGQLHFVGMGVGGQLGSLYNAVATDTHRVVLNATAGDLPRILLTTQDPSLTIARNAFLAGLAAQGLRPGTPAFDNFVGFTKWIVDPADPLNAGVHLAKGKYAAADRRAFIQYIEGDMVLPNLTTEELIAATIRPGDKSCAGGGSPPCADVFEFKEADFSSVMPAPAERHGFLLNNASGLTADAQSQVVQYLTQGTVKTTFP